MFVAICSLEAEFFVCCSINNMASHRESGMSNVSRRKSNGTSRPKPEENRQSDPKRDENLKRQVGTHTLAVGLSIAIAVGSILHENDMVPDSFFSNRHNPLNQRFVKWSWGWTLCIMTPYMLLLSWARAPGQVSPALRGVLRLLALTACWYFWVEIVMFTVHEWTGKCSVASHGDSKACRRGGGRWEGFDISGHSFLLVLIILTTQEELAPLWHLHESSGVKFVFPSGGQDMKRLPVVSFVLENLLYALAIVISLLQSLSAVMVIATSLYFHAISHKILGTAIALFTWSATYRYWFQSDSPFALPLS